MSGAGCYPRRMNPSDPAVDAGTPPQDSEPRLSIEGPRATIVLNRPSQHNRIDPDDVQVLREHLAQVRATPAVRALVITGSGERTFSSGYTLQAIVERLHERAFEAFLDELEAMPLPTIAAINGGVYGGATDLALCCDLRIGVGNTRMFMPASKLGLHYYPGGMRRYVARLGLTAASKLFLTATTIGAPEMLRIGFLTDLVEAGCLEETVERYVAEIGAGDAHAITAMKRSLAELGATAGTPAIEQRYLASLQSDELRARLAQLLGPSR